MQCSKGIIEISRREDRRANKTHFHLFGVFDTFAHLDIVRVVKIVSLFDI